MKPFLAFWSQIANKAVPPLSKTISLTIEAIFLGSQVPDGYNKNKQAAALLTCDTAQRSSVVGYPLYQSSMQ